MSAVPQPGVAEAPLPDHPEGTERAEKRWSSTRTKKNVCGSCLRYTIDILYYRAASQCSAPAVAWSLTKRHGVINLLLVISFFSPFFNFLYGCAGQTVSASSRSSTCLTGCHGCTRVRLLMSMWAGDLGAFSQLTLS